MRIETDRLILRDWAEEDRAPFAGLNADPDVMRHFPAALTRADSDALIDRLRARRAEDGTAFMAVELKGEGFVGMAGLGRPRFEAPFTPCVEIGWRLARHAWGRGIASEAARGWVAHGFGALGLGEIVAFTAAGNDRSRRVMERIGMVRDADGDFDHPALPEGHALRRHVLYRVARERWREAEEGP